MLGAEDISVDDEIKGTGEIFMSKHTAKVGLVTILPSSFGYGGISFSDENYHSNCQYRLKMRSINSAQKTVSTRLTGSDICFGIESSLSSLPPVLIQYLYIVMEYQCKNAFFCKILVSCQEATCEMVCEIELFRFAWCVPLSSGIRSLTIFYLI